MRVLKGWGVIRSGALALAVVGAIGLAVSVAPRTEAGATATLRYSALLLHESQIFDQPWEMFTGTTHSNLVKYRTHSWMYSEVIIHNPNNVPVGFCWKVTSPAQIGTPDCTGTIPANGVVVFDTFNLAGGGFLVGPKGILEIETASTAGPLIVWQHHNKHSKGETVYSNFVHTVRIFRGRTMESFQEVTPPVVPPIGSGVSVDVERVHPELIQP